MEKSQKPKTTKTAKAEKYFEAVGKRKTAVARVRIFASKKKKKDEEIFTVNNKPLKEYFSGPELQETVFSPFKETDFLNSFRVSARVRGGGISSQAGAVRHGIAKALIIFDPDLRKKLKKTGFLTRDSRMRERKKFGLKRARRAPQWSKR